MPRRGVVEHSFLHVLTMISPGTNRYHFPFIFYEHSETTAAADKKKACMQQPIYERNLTSKTTHSTTCVNSSVFHLHVFWFLLLKIQLFFF